MENINDFIRNIKKPPRGYGLVPFWFWNDKLDTKHLLWQIDEMYEKGAEGFIIHARRDRKSVV